LIALAMKIGLVPCELSRVQISLSPFLDESI
jgi:hypothetical protein